MPWSRDYTGSRQYVAKMLLVSEPKIDAGAKNIELIAVIR